MEEAEKRAEVRAALNEARRDLDTFKDLEETAAWIRLKQIAEGQISKRTKDLMQPEIALREAGTSSDYCKGMIEGIRLMMAMPEIARVYAKETIDSVEIGVDEEVED